MADHDGGKFVVFGQSHILALALILALAAALAAAGWHARNRRTLRSISIGLGALLLLDMLVWTIYVPLHPEVPIQDMVPLQLCDLTVVMAIVALFYRSRQAYELTYYWCFAAGFQTMLTPDLSFTFPDYRCVHFFIKHGGVFVAVSFMLTAFRVRHDWPSTLRCFKRAMLATNAYALLVGVVDWSFRANYMYLCQKPDGRTILNYFGPWPWYLVGAELYAVALFFVCYAPFLAQNLLREAEVARA